MREQDKAHIRSLVRKYSPDEFDSIVAMLGVAGEDDERDNRPKWRALSEETKRRMRELHRQGMAPIDIARELGVNRTTVYKYIKEAE